MSGIVRKALELFQIEMEKINPFESSMLTELTKPSLPGGSGYNYSYTRGDVGVAVSIWDSGVFEIHTDMMNVENEDYLFFSYIPDEFEEIKFPVKSVNLFLEKINAFLFSLNKTYPNISTRLQL